MHVFPRSRLIKIATLAGVAIFSAYVFWNQVFPRIFVFDTKQTEKHVPATVFTDCLGNPIHTEPGSDYALRFPVSSDSLPQHLKDVVLATEDRNFFAHDGVDLFAVARAGMQLVSNGSIVSGASTITMQLVAQEDERRNRSFIRKIVQMGKARNLERQWSKERILEEYFNRLPYGGKIYGIEAAAQYYFGRPASELNIGESVMLAGIPQRPNRFRPDRFPEAAALRRERVLGMLVRQGVFSEEKAESIRREPLRFRDFTQRAFPRAEDPQFFLWAREKHPEIRGKYVTTLNMTIQKIVKEAVTSQIADKQTVRDGAAIVIENNIHAVRAFLGTTNFLAPRDGQVNAATALRSPGSLIKPFIFGEAINGGLLVPDTLVDDAPIRSGDYNPENFSGEYLGSVPAKIALSKSLNTPAVRILATLGTERVTETLEKFGLPLPSGKTARSVGLSLALGGAESSLVQLAQAYSALAGGGIPATLSVLENAERPSAETPIWSPGCADMVLKMLRVNSLPRAENLDVAWKTGTSNGLRDAWCIAVTREWTVAVWFGNKDGSTSPELVGAEIAAPVAGQIMNALYRGKHPAPWNDDSCAKTLLLCRQSGLTAGSFCQKTFPGKALVGIPLKTCPACKKIAAKNPFSQKTQIVAPAAGTYRTGFNGKARFILRSVPAKAHWYLNGNYIGFLSSGTSIELLPGRHCLYAWGGSDYSASDLKIEVK